MSALESPSHSPSASPASPNLSSPSASCREHKDIQILTSDRASLHLTNRSLTSHHERVTLRAPEMGKQVNAAGVRSKLRTST